MAPGFSPLDEALGLLPGHLTPWLAEGVVLLGANQPFAVTSRALAHFTGTAIGAATARRLTERAGAAWVQLDLAEVARLEADPAAASPPPGGPVHQLSVDGVYVPLVGGEWREVKVLAVGTVEADGEGGGTTADLSYLARLADHTRFGREALAELHRRGTLAATTVVAVQDGAEWIQGFLDLHTPAAVRVLDFAHAAGYLGHAAQAAFGAGTARTGAWLATWLHELKHGDPAAVLAALAALPASAARDEALGYLTPRRAQIRYAEFLAAGYPIGSGCVESAGKLLVQGRLCGAGMHWAARNVDPMLGVRSVVATPRWAAAWDRIAAHLRRQARQVRATRRNDRRAKLPTPPVRTPLPAPTGDAPGSHASPPVSEVVLRLRQELRDRPKCVVNGRPTADHPLKRGYRSPLPTPAPPLLPKL